MKLVLLVLIALIGVSVAVDPSLIQVGVSKMQEISQTQMGQFIMELAQSHAEARGPLDDLVSAIGDLENELKGELDAIENEYTHTTNQHLNTQQGLDLTIGSTEIAINNARENIEEILIPGRDQAQNKIEKVQQFIADNRDLLSRETVQRQNNHQLFLDRVSEHQSAISAVDESLQLVKSLLNGNIALTEKKTLHQSVKLIESRITKRNEISPLIEALLSLTQNFADQGAVQQIKQMLEDVRNKVVASLNEETANEKVLENQWVDRQKQINQEYKDFQKTVLETTYVLTAYQNKLNSEQESIATNQADLETYQESLQQDKDTQATETQLYTELKTQYLQEIAVVRGALDFINSAEFSAAMTSRLNTVA